MAKWQQELRTKQRDSDSPFAPDAEIYFINVSLAEIADPDERASLMKIPTTLYLTEEQIGRLLGAASRLIRHDNGVSTAHAGYWNGQVTMFRLNVRRWYRQILSVFGFASNCWHSHFEGQRTTKPRATTCLQSFQRPCYDICKRLTRKGSETVID